ncbi:transglutaminase family protein [Sphingomonas sp.]|jgi:transglutaminase-like putative cysteine protease|uniref:transglutaminase family protein n=1 Tax=Sphingomonas sp. TaxID=28214 RepID=UPI002D7FBEB8|nr:transglutaminase family protein [Sphingomonas sp.]HEU0043173.1 transglutaminase family protein [Sphingomonas sp.]
MPFLNLSHVTTYTYKQPVSFGEHRIMVRPRESFDLRLLEATLRIEPEPSDLRWLQDVFGNAVAIATFDRQATRLCFDSRIHLEHTPAEVEHVDIEDYARIYPFTYSAEDMPDLLRSIERQHLDPLRQIDGWVRRFLDPAGTDTLTLLSDITAAIKREFTYVGRAEKGTQSPIETLTRRKGTCRDFAMLMIEAVRALGFAARFVSGYVYDPAGTDGRVGGGNTHAWVRVYLPGSGWVEFDPTNGTIGNAGLIRVAIVRDIYQAVPISGTWGGFPGSFLDMTVNVDVAIADPEPVASIGLKETVSC